MKRCISKRINAPIADVFESFINIDTLANQLTTLVSIQNLTDEIVQKGTILKEIRKTHTKVRTRTIKITEIERPYCLSFSSRYLGTVINHSLLFLTQDHKTEVVLKSSSKAKGLSSKVFEALFGRHILNKDQKLIVNDLEELRIFLESPSLQSKFANYDRSEVICS